MRNGNSLRVYGWNMLLNALVGILYGFPSVIGYLGHSNAFFVFFDFMRDHGDRLLFRDAIGPVD